MQKDYNSIYFILFLSLDKNLFYSTLKTLQLVDVLIVRRQKFEPSSAIGCHKRHLYEYSSVSVFIRTIK